MIKIGNTIVYKTESFVKFYWLCDIQGDYLVFFNWYGNPYRASSNDFWEMSKKWFNEKVNSGELEVYESLPWQKYGDIFDKQAIEMNNK